MRYGRLVSRENLTDSYCVIVIEHDGHVELYDCDSEQEARRYAKRCVEEGQEGNVEAHVVTVQHLWKWLIGANGKTAQKAWPEKGTWTAK